MPDPRLASPSLERLIIPPPRGGETITPVILTDADEAANAAMKRAVGVGNYSVYGALGDCNNPELQTRIMREIKGEERDPDKPLGLTIPIHHPQVRGVFATKHIKNRQLRELLENPDEFANRFGGIAFVRGEADMNAVNLNGLPPSAVSNTYRDRNTGELIPPQIQIYSPVDTEGLNEEEATAASVIKKMLKLGGLPVMSSLNQTDTPEITTTEEARRFATLKGLPLVEDMPDHRRRWRPRGSYPIFWFTADGILVPRAGWMAKDLAMRALDGLPVLPFTPKHKYPDNVLRLRDLPEEAWDKTGPELCKVIRKVITTPAA